MFSRVWMYVVLAGTAILALGYLHARLDRANQADALEAELSGVRAQAVATDQKATALETELQAVRLQVNETNRKWSNIRAEKNRSVCLLDPGTISLLKSAGSPDAR